MRKFYLVLLMITSLTISGFSQKFTISGYVKDKQTGEYLFGANVYLKENMKGAQTNQYGYYAITADKGSYTLVVSYMGYVEHTETLELKENKKINIELDEKVITKQEVVITGEKDDKNTSSVDMGKVQMDVEKIKSLPAFHG